MKHKYQLGQEVKIRTDENTKPSSRAHGYDGQVGVVIGLTARPEYETEYVVGLKSKRDPQSRGQQKAYKLHVNEEDLTPVRTVKAYAYRIKSSKRGEIVWHMEDLGNIKNLERVPELDMEKQVA